MSFRDILEKNKALNKLWRIANNQKENMDDENENDGNPSLSLICEQLDRCVNRTDEDPRGRMSLRASAMLINGAAKLYKKRMQKLVEDVAKLDKEIATRNKTTIEESSTCSPEDVQMLEARDRAESDVESEKTNDDISEILQENESSHPASQTNFEMISDQQVTDKDASENRPIFTGIFDKVVGLPNNEEELIHEDVNTNSTGSNRNRVNKGNRKTSLRKSGGKIVKNKSDSRESYKTRRAFELSTDDREIGNDDGSQRSDTQMSARECAIPKVRRNTKGSKSTTIRKDQASQCNFFHPQMRDRDGNSSNHEGPFGYLFIHDSINSRIPSKVIFSSLTDDVNRL